jgi:O-antigen/teichoic acid export membrane protein
MLLFLEAEDIVSVFLTNKWLPIVFPLRVLCIVSCLRSIEFLNAPLVLAKGKPNLVVQNYIVIGIVLPISFYVGSKYGINGLSLSWLYIFPLVFLFTAYRSINLIGISLFEYLKELKHSFIGTFVATIIIFYSKTVLLNEFNYLANMIATTVAFLALYAIYILIFQKHLYFELKTLFK